MDLIEQSKELVVKLAIEDREQYSKFLNLAKEFAIKNNIYILNNRIFIFHIYTFIYFSYYN